MIQLHKDNQRLLTENDILKQAALIIGQSVGAHKTANLVYNALSSIKRDLRSIQLFHTNRVTEFKKK